VRLHIGIGGAEELLRPLDRELLRNVHEFAAAVIALARIALGVLVGEHGALGCEHARACVILGRDELEMLLLATPFRSDRTGEGRIEGFDAHTGSEHGISCSSALKWSAKSTRTAPLRPTRRRPGPRGSRRARC